VQPRFLSIAQVLRIHQFQVGAYGGDPGILNMGLLESAIGQPEARFGGVYLHADLAAMAAAYLYHIARNHPFADGNMRTGMHAAIAFLDINGVRLAYPVDATEDLVLRVAQGIATKEQAAEFFRGLIASQHGPGTAA
jgi:death on curing protein